MQKVLAVMNGTVCELCLPSPKEELMPGVLWGDFDQFFTPAYWASQVWMLTEDASALTFKLGRTLKEETAACMLGGHGITAEMSLAAYDALRHRGLLDSKIVTQAELASALKEPMSYEGRTFRYRFPNKKAQFLAPALNALSDAAPPADDHKAFRHWFLQFMGVGLKTASWITRNWLNSSEVAILDIHVIRCGLMCGLFNKRHDPARSYLEMEALFLRFAERLNVEAAKLDVLIWQQMRSASSARLSLLKAA